MVFLATQTGLESSDFDSSTVRYPSTIHGMKYGYVEYNTVSVEMVINKPAK